jgi:hypothetical protein
MKTYLPYVLIALAAMIFLVPDLQAQDTVRSRESATERTRQGQQSQERQQVQNQQFVDLDGDGYNDNAPDHDGDGIPNRLDPDWKRRNRMGQTQFIDLNGDGINDKLQQDQRNGLEQMDREAGEEDGSSLKNQEQRQLRRGRKGSGRSGS